MSAGQIHALKYGCMPTLEVCRQSWSLGDAVADSAKYMKRKQGRNCYFRTSILN